MSRTKSDFFVSVKGVQSETLTKIAPLLQAFIAGFLFSKASIFLKSSPFGVAFLGAADLKGLNGIAALLGVIAGYITLGFGGVKYILAAISIFALRVILQKKGFTYGNIYSAVSSGLMVFISGIIEATQYGFILYDVLTVIAETVICITIAYFFMKAYPFFTDETARTAGLSQNELISVVITMSVLMLSLSTFTFFDISLGRAAGIFIVLTAALYGGMAQGSMAGVIVGLIMSFGKGAGTHIVGTYAFGGLLGGVFSTFGKTGTSIAFVIANAVLTMYFNGSSEILINIYEILFAGAVFILMPEKFIKKTANFLLLYNYDEKTHPEKFKTLFLNRLKMASNSFSQLAETLKAVGLLKKNTSAADITPILGLAADTVCKKCRSCMFCWGTAYNDTMNIFNDMSTVFSTKGKIEKEDFPAYFTARCEKSEMLAGELNLRLSEHWAKERQELKSEENRVILAEQYSGVSQIMEKLADELNKAVKFDTLSEQRITAYLIKNGIKNPSVSCYTDADGLLVIEASAVIPVDIKDLKKFNAEISLLTGCQTDICYMTEEGGIWHAKLTEREDYSIAFARASCGKDGKTVCGDTSSAFRGEGGKYIMTISDGMGSGREAERDSMLTVSFLEKLLKAGFDKESALKLVNSVLMLKSSEETFATVDITVINLVTGLAEFVKAGAAPTFVKRGTSVYELGCSSLPAGILAEARFEKARCKLKESDMIIMASDGVTSVGSKLLTKIASDYKGDSPAELAEIILNEAIKINGKVDDMTVAVGYFTKK